MLVAASALARVTWTKSGRSASVANCVEAAAYQGGVVVRNSKDPKAGALLFTAEEFSAFVGGAFDGDFDHLTE
jgi:hypothetical protein